METKEESLCCRDNSEIAEQNYSADFSTKNYLREFFKFVSVKHNGSLSSSLRWGYSFKFVKKACIILLHEIKLPIKPLASLKSLQPPYDHVAL